MVKETAERVQALVPEMRVTVYPHGRLLHGQGVNLAAHHPPFLGAGNQPGGFEHGQVLHEAGQRHGMPLRQFADADRPAALVQLRQHTPTRGVGQGGEDAVELGFGFGGVGFKVNHLV